MIRTRSLALVFGKFILGLFFGSASTIILCSRFVHTRWCKSVHTLFHNLLRGGSGQLFDFILFPRRARRKVGFEAVVMIHAFIKIAAA